MSWVKFCVGIVVSYLAINAIFAIFFVLNGVENINGLEPGTTIENFVGAFFFSVQTFTTVGYGALSPNGVMANFIAAMDSRKQPISDVWSHNRMLETCHLANIAIRLGRELQWDPAKREIIGDEQANSFLARENRSGYAIDL